MFQLFVALFLTVTYECARRDMYGSQRDHYTMANHIRACELRGYIGLVK